MMAAFSPYLKMAGMAGLLLEPRWPTKGKQLCDHVEKMF